MKSWGILLVFVLIECVGYSQVELPRPSGTYEVGIKNLFLKRTISETESRQLNTWVYYPAKRATKLHPRMYLHDSILLAAMKEENYLGYSNEVLMGWAAMKTNSYPDAKPVKGKFPMVFILHGRGSSKINYTFMSQELASHGYVVVVADHPGSGITILSDGTKQGLLNPADLTREVREIAEDVRFLRKELLVNDFTHARIDQTKVGIVGHSLGAMAMFDLSSDTSDFDVTANLDGYPTEQAVRVGLHKPHLTLLGEVPTWITIRADTLKSRRTKTFNKLASGSGNDFGIVEIKGMYHKDFNDLIFFRSESDLNRYTNPIHPSRGYAILTQVLLNHLNSFLKEKSERTDANWMRTFPEISTQHENRYTKPLR